MSATADAQLFQTYFLSNPNIISNLPIQSIHTVPCISIPGKTYPVTDYYMEDAIEMCGYTLSLDSDYAISQSKSIHGSERVSVKSGAKSVQIRLEWSIDDLYNDSTDTGSNEQVDEVCGDVTGYSKSTKSAMQLLDYDKINLDLMESLVYYIARTRPAQSMDASQDEKEQECGAILVFLPGIREIDDLSLRLGATAAAEGVSLHILSLHGSMDHEAQSAVFEPPPLGHVKVVLSTNIAETGITIVTILAYQYFKPFFVMNDYNSRMLFM